MTLTATRFQTILLKWFDIHGRKTLPWQLNKTPYRVWVSEIMLQQTQVTTATPYFEQFMQRFPDLAALAQAREDDVLHLWAGLGYYSRARNLLRAAQAVMTQHAGQFPQTLAELKALPGIGPSTAGAILAIAFNQPAAILDGNVKRVLTRLYGITNPINDKTTENKLWELAQTLIPTKRPADYTQAIMDLGATFCTQSKPACERCPFSKACIAYQQNLVASIPAKNTTRKIPTRTATLLILKHNKRILLEKRPPTGIWGSLFSLPELAGKPEQAAIRAYCRQQFRLTIDTSQVLPPFRHTFSHYHLQIHPVLVTVKSIPKRVMEEGRQIWYNLRQPAAIGLPKPVQTIIQGLT